MKWKQLITIGMIILFSDTARAQTSGTTVTCGNDNNPQMTNTPTGNVFVQTAGGILTQSLRDPPDEWLYPVRRSLFKRLSSNDVNDTSGQTKHGGQARAVERYGCRFLGASPSRYPKARVDSVIRQSPSFPEVNLLMAV